MFHLHSAFAIQLLTVVAAAALLAWTGYAHVHAKKLIQVIAYSVIVLSVLSLLCTAYYGAKYSRAGYFQHPAGMHGMMHKGSQNGNMMEEMMGGGMGSGATGDNDAAPESDTHSHDHDR